jgi:ATP phosphoribosyltransferase regulatory subunit
MPSSPRKAKLPDAKADTHPLPLAPPRGMHDLLPEETAARAALSRKVLSTFRSYGYSQVSTPAFELAEVIERGLTADRRDLLRFVEPESGEVALLRPDITPQIARIVATSLRDKPGPHRISYEGSIFRRRRGRARRQQQIYQAGVELIHEHGPEADAEVIELATEACFAAGVRELKLELAHVGIGRAALEPVPDSARAAVMDSVARKDGAALEAQLRAAGLDASERRTLLALIGFYGDVDVIRRARRALRTRAMIGALDALAAVVELLEEAGLATHLAVDLGELRGQAYYTGVSFALWADGPGEAIGAGGRYDNLLGQFGGDGPATGFALNLENLEWALRSQGRSIAVERAPRVVLVGPDRAVARTLRARGVETLELRGQTKAQAIAYAKAWGFEIVVQSGKRTSVIRTADGAAQTIDLDDEAALARCFAWGRADQAQTEVM